MAASLHAEGKTKEWVQGSSKSNSLGSKAGHLTDLYEKEELDRWMKPHSKEEVLPGAEGWQESKSTGEIQRVREMGNL